MPRSKGMRGRGKSTGRPTTKDVLRWSAMREIGCIACIVNSWFGHDGFWKCPMNIEMHHLLSGGRRIGHQATVALCHWHHQAKRFPDPARGYKEQATLYGPSLEREPRLFHEIYGSDEEILAMQNELLVMRTQQALKGEME